MNNKNPLNSKWVKWEFRILPIANKIQKGRT